MKARTLVLVLLAGLVGFGWAYTPLSLLEVEATPQAPSGTSASGVRPACSDGRDNDGDGQKDSEDGGCAAELDFSEHTQEEVSSGAARSSSGPAMDGELAKRASAYCQTQAEEMEASFRVLADEFLAAVGASGNGTLTRTKTPLGFGIVYRESVQERFTVAEHHVWKGRYEIVSRQESFNLSLSVGCSVLGMTRFRDERSPCRRRGEILFESTDDYARWLCEPVPDSVYMTHEHPGETIAQVAGFQALTNDRLFIVRSTAKGSGGIGLRRFLTDEGWRHAGAGADPLPLALQVEEAPELEGKIGAKVEASRCIRANPL